jgi:hypothetical protein
MHGRLYICVYVLYICMHAFINICVLRMLTPCMYVYVYTYFSGRYVSANLGLQYTSICMCSHRKHVYAFILVYSCVHISSA